MNALFGVEPAASSCAPISFRSLSASFRLSACFRNLVGGHPRSIFPGSIVDSSIHASQAWPVHIAENESKSIQKVLLLHTGQSLQCMLDRTVIPSSPTWSTSHTTRSDLVRAIRWDFRRNLLRTFHAISSVENIPSPIAPPSSSVTEGTKTREGAVMNGAVRIKPFNPSSILVRLLPIHQGVGMGHLAFPFVSKSIQQGYCD